MRIYDEPCGAPLWGRGVPQTNQTPPQDLTPGSDRKATVSAAISSWTRAHTCGHTHTHTHTNAHTHSGRGWRVTGEGAHLIGAMSSSGSWNSSLINGPKYHLIYHGEGGEGGEERMVRGRLKGDWGEPGRETLPLRTPMTTVKRSSLTFKAIYSCSYL